MLLWQTNHRRWQPCGGGGCGIAGPTVKNAKLAWRYAKVRYSRGEDLGYKIHNEIYVFIIITQLMGNCVIKTLNYANMLDGQ